MCSRLYSRKATYGFVFSEPFSLFCSPMPDQGHRGCGFNKNNIYITKRILLNPYHQTISDTQQG